MTVALRVVHERPHTALPDGEPAQIDSDGQGITVAHARFHSTVDPFAREGRIHCAAEDEALARDLTHRAALSAILPLEGGLLLHSAGVIVEGNAIAFFGPSGAGKTTLSSFVDQPLLSDELIAIRPGFVAEATGIWGELPPRARVDGSFPLTHLVALDRGDDLTLDPLTPREAARALIAVAVVPPHPALWHAAMQVVQQLAHLPASRLRWSPSRENAQHLLARFL